MSATSAWRRPSSSSRWKAGRGYALPVCSTAASMRACCCATRETPLRWRLPSSPPRTRSARWWKDCGALCARAPISRSRRKTAAPRELILRTLAALLWMLLWQPLAPQAQAAPSAAPAPTTAPARTAAASGGGAAAAPAAGAAAAPSGASAASTAPDSAPVPLASVPAASEAVNAEILKVQNTLDADETEQRIRTALSEAVSDVDTRLDETSRVTEDSPDLPDLRELAGGWQKTRDSLGGWQQDLTDQAARLEKDAQRLQSLAAQWDATLEAARAATGTPQDVVQRIERTGEALRKEHDAVEKRRAALLSLLDQVATQLGRSSQALSEIDRASKRIVDEVFLRQNAPIWRAHGGTATAEAAQGNQSFAARLRALADYADRAQEMIALHAVVVIVLAAALMLIRRRVRA